MNLLHVHILKVPLPFFHSFLELFAIFDNSALNHFTQQVVALSGSFTDTGKYRESVVTFCDIVDELHDKHGLAHTGAAEQTDFSTFAIWFQQVYHLDSGVQNLCAYR